MVQLSSVLTLLAVGALNTATPAAPAAKPMVKPAPAPAVAGKYSAVDITIKADQSAGQLSVSPSASPLLGAKNPPVRGGMAYVGASYSQGSYNVALSSKVPARLHFDLSQGSLNANLSGMALSTLDLKTDQTGARLVLPAANLGGVLNTSQGQVTLTVPKNVGVKVNLVSWSMGSLTINGQKTVDSMEASGSYSTPNFDRAAYKMEFDLSSDMTSWVIQQH